MTFVKFTDYHRPAAPGYQTDLDEIIAAVVKRTKESTARHPKGVSFRTAHGKTYGLVRAKVTVLDGLPSEYAQGIYARPGEYEAAIRYSNGLGHVRPDPYLGPACGMGIKMFGIPGAGLLDDEATASTFDYNLINNPTFFCNTVRDYTVIEPLFAALPDAFVNETTRNKWLHDFLTGGGALPPEEWLWDELFSIVSFTTVQRTNLLGFSYWSMGALRHGDYIAKVRTRPTDESAASIAHATIDFSTDVEAFRNTLVAELKERDHRFALQVQLCKDLEKMPVDNTSREWPEAASPFVTVAYIDIPRQDIGGEDNIDLAETVSITPWRVRAEHEPLGEIMEVRREVYRQSSIVRHEVNGQARKEPANLDELFG